MTAALIIPVMYSNTGDWSWLSYALGTVMLLFVAYNLNQFARRSTTSGSMYAYICRGLGLTAGGIGGWSLIWAYLGISMAGVTGFSIFAGKLLGDDGHRMSPLIVLFAVCVRHRLVLRLEERPALGGPDADRSKASRWRFILLLCSIVLGQHHLAIDTRAIRRSASCPGRASAWASWWRSSAWSASNAPPPSATKRRTR